jgi:hypothetical protein
MFRRIRRLSAGPVCRIGSDTAPEAYGVDPAGCADTQRLRELIDAHSEGNGKDIRFALARFSHGPYSKKPSIVA